MSNKKIFMPKNPNPAWTFGDKTQKDTSYATHCYHRYPAKFIPQLASKIIEEHTIEGAVVADVFAGCGTTLVEAKIHGRESLGIDINPVACLITNAKITPVSPERIDTAYTKLKEVIHKTAPTNNKIYHDRINYWFKEKERDVIDHLLAAINTSFCKQPKERLFFTCAFSNILKNCSIWGQKSNKPIRDLEKIPADPLIQFNKQVKKMLTGLETFYSILKKNKRLGIKAKIFHSTAKSCVKIRDDSVDLIVTSPPYATSYEYADLHQLTALWLEYTQDIREFRKDFVGSFSAGTNAHKNDAAADTVNALAYKSRKMASHLAKYFCDMRDIFYEMRRILKKDGKAAIVIGDTKLRGVAIPNAEIFLKYLIDLNLLPIEIIQREIPSKNIPSTRDPKTGKFVSVTSKDIVFSYPTEYILIVQKS